MIDENRNFSRCKVTQYIRDVGNQAATKILRGRSPEDAAVAYLAAFAVGKNLDVPPASIERVTQ